MLIHFHSENHNTLTYGDAIAVVEQRLVFCSFSVYVGLEVGLKEEGGKPFENCSMTNSK